MSHSQHGEENLIEELLALPENYTGKYVDIGACWAKELSNTYHFYEKGWSGLIVEPNPNFFEELEGVRTRDILVKKAISNFNGQLQMIDTATIGSFLGDDYKNRYDQGLPNRPGGSIWHPYTVECITMNTLIAQYPDFNSPDFVSIDIETNEDKLLEGTDFTLFRPKLIIIEYEVRSVDYRPKWEHFILPFYDFKKVLAGNAFYLRKTE